MQQRHGLLRIYGPLFCEAEAGAVVRMLQMIAHESEIASVALTVVKDKDNADEEEDAEGDENQSENADPAAPATVGPESEAEKPADGEAEAEDGVGSPKVGEGEDTQDKDKERERQADEDKDPLAGAGVGGGEVDENGKVVDVSMNLFASSKFLKSESGSGNVGAKEGGPAPGGEKREKASPGPAAASGSGTDVRLPPFVRKQLDAIRDAETADDLMVAEEKLNVLIPNEVRRHAYMRVFKWIVSFATWKYEVAKDSLDGSGFHNDELYYGALGHTAHEKPEREAEREYDTHKAPLKRVKTISTSAGCSFGKPSGDKVKAPGTATVSDVTRRRVMKRTG
jgi:hypothetical protein